MRGLSLVIEYCIVICDGGKVGKVSMSVNSKLDRSEAYDLSSRLIFNSTWVFWFYCSVLLESPQGKF